MISCTIRYEIDPDRLDAFETYARFWIHQIPRMGGVHHGYHLPHEGASDVAWCHFSFPSLAAYEAYRAAMRDDADCERAYAFAKATGCIRRIERSFTRPVIEGAPADALGLPPAP